MTAWESGSARLYRRIARAFPYRFRVVCGNGLERLGEDVAPMVWREEGVPGLVRLFADLVLRLSVAHVQAWTDTWKELTMSGDVFEGTWKAQNDKSQWDPAYTPEQACLRFEPTDTGYLMVAYGVKDSKAVAERPTAIIADGRRRPVVDLNGRPVPGVPAGAMAFGDRPNPRTLVGGVELDGKSLGGGTYEVSEDGRTLTVIVEGMGLKGPFKTRAVFERVVPDPYLPQR